MTNRGLVKATTTLGLVSLAAAGIGVLALADISHGEADLRLEWHAVQIAAVLILAFHVAALSTLRHVLRNGTV